MRRITLLSVAFCALGGIAFSHQSPEIQQRIAAAKEAAARNQQALQSYSWMAKTEVLLKGEVKNTKIEQCQYDSDGKVLKTEIDGEPQQEEQQSGRRRGRRGGLAKKAVVARKTGEMQEVMQAAVALVQSYVPPAQEKIQAVVAAGGVSLTPATGNQAIIQFANYAKEGDSLTLTLDTVSRALLHVGVDSWLDDTEKTVTLDVEFDSLSDGTNYAAKTILAIPDDDIEVHIENSDYQKLER